MEWAFVDLTWRVSGAIKPRDLMGCAGAAKPRLGNRNSETRKALYMAQKALVEDDIGKRKIKTRRVGLC